MFNVKELKEIINELNDDVVIYVEADHGQQSEQASYIFFTKDDETPYYGEDLEWEDIEDCDFNKVKSIKIMA